MDDTRDDLGAPLRSISAGQSLGTRSTACLSNNRPFVHIVSSPQTRHVNGRIYTGRNSWLANARLEPRHCDMNSRARLASAPRGCYPALCLIRPTKTGGISLNRPFDESGVVAPVFSGGKARSTTASRTRPASKPGPGAPQAAPMKVRMRRRLSVNGHAQLTVGRQITRNLD